MSSILRFEPSKARSLPIKTKVIWALGVYIEYITYMADGSWVMAHWMSVLFLSICWNISQTQIHIHSLKPTALKIGRLIAPKETFIWSKNINFQGLCMLVRYVSLRDGNRGWSIYTWNYVYIYILYIYLTPSLKQINDFSWLLQDFRFFHDMFDVPRFCWNHQHRRGKKTNSKEIVLRSIHT